MNIVIFMTAKDLTEAQSIVKKLVEERLIACGNILPQVKSFFWWQNKVDECEEALVVMKTKKSFFKKVEKVIKSLHSYDVPEIIALPICAGNKDYLTWMDQSLKRRNI